MSATHGLTSVCQIPADSSVLVTGATGFTGSVLLRKLVAAGLKVRAIARSTSNLEPFKGLAVDWRRGEVYDPQVIREACQGVEYIFHVAAAFRAAKIPDSEYRRVHVDSTKHLAEAALNSPGFKRFIHVSTMGVHGHIETPPGHEESPFAPGDEYQRTKAEAEKWLRPFAAEKHLPYVIIRPTGIYGPGDRRLLKIFKMASWPIFPILGQGKCLYHFIHVDDLCDAMLQAATEPRALGEAFLIGNPEAIPLVDVARAISEVYGRNLRVLRIPVGPFFLAADLCEALCRPLGIEPPIYRRRVAFYTKDRSFNTSKMQKLLGFSPKFSNLEGLRATARWYLEQGWVRL